MKSAHDDVLVTAVGEQVGRCWHGYRRVLERSSYEFVLIGDHSGAYPLLRTAHACRFRALGEALFFDEIQHSPDTQCRIGAILPAANLSVSSGAW